MLRIQKINFVIFELLPYSYYFLCRRYIRRSGLTEVPDFSMFNTSYQNLGVMQEM